MSNLVKLYHYCYYATFDNFHERCFLQHSHISKNCYLGVFDEEKCEIKCEGWNLTFYGDDCPIKMMSDISDNSIMFDYFTIDELNVYENFINKAMNFLASSLAKYEFKNKEVK